MKNPNTKFLILLMVTTASLLTVQSYAQSKGPGGPQRGLDFSMQNVLEQLDSNGDGTVTRDEIDARQQAQLKEFDSNGDGSMNLEEFSVLWSSLNRERMVNAFQAIDNDGTGELTADELNARTEGLMRRLDQDRDGSIVLSEILRGGNRSYRDRNESDRSRRGRKSE
ncbi:MAG: EF-hand domain-containing protein [Arenicellaceae bacterium]|nr:EF-hand domain-containing protein [Arenicellaceae bacterium]